MSVPHGEAEARKPSEAVSAAYITDKRFADLPISPLSIRAMNEVLKYQYMTHVQSMCIPPIQSGIDCLAKSKTGTGKTLAFLIPAIESILQRPARVPLSILVLSPTRELALQISKEAEALLTFHRGTKVVTVVGGTNINSDKNRLAGDVTILVATPGRLIDHIDNTTGFAAKLASIKVLVLDEADRLLDMGFKPSIDRILAALPNKSARQTLLFSATIPKGVLDIAANAMRPGYATINTTGTDDDSGQTHLHVHQELVTVPFEDLIPAIGAVLDQQMKKFPNDFKIIVFFTTARMTGFMAQIFGDAGIDVLEIHSRKSQGHRTSTSERFKNGKRMVLFSSDVTARGMDYPDVTFVLQVGLTDKEQYIHRLGRTARAGKEGCGMIMLYPFEESNMLHELRDLPIHRIDTAAIGLDAFRSRYATLLASSMRNPARIREAEQAYVAWMGFYNSCLRRVGFDKVKLVQMANTFATIIGLTEQPTLLKKTVGMMGLKGVPGLKIA
jgi:ATP-dependent RNA helicase MSS116